MKSLKDQAGAIEAVVIGIVLIAAVVAVGAVVVHNNKKSTTSTVASTSSTANVTPSAEALDNTLVTLGLQHMTLTDEAIDSTLDGNKDATAFATALYTNGTDIGAAVGSVYGSSAQTTFNSVWKLHLDQFVNYAVADSKGDSAGKQAALDAINTGYTVPLSQYLAKANPNLPEKTLQTLLTDHVTMTAQIIDDHVQGNYTQEASDLKTADQHITTIFSTLAGAIAKQYPSKFAN